MVRRTAGDVVSPQRLVICVAFACSLAVKLAGVAYMNRYLAWNLMAPDTQDQYRVLALNLLEHRGYQFNDDYRDATRIAPGFPLYLAAVYKLAGLQAPTWLFGVFNAVSRAVVTCLILALAFRAFGAWPALLAASIHALDPWEAFWTPFVLKESLAVLLSVVAVCAVAWMLESGRSTHAAVAGVAIALAALTRYATLGWFGVALGLLVLCAAAGHLSAKSAARLAVAMTVGLLLGLSPWLMRNRQVFGKPLLYTQPGYAFYVSNGPGTERVRDTSGYSGWSTIDEASAREIARRHPDASARDAALFRSAVVHAVSNPVGTATTIGARLVNMWRPTFVGASTANVLVLGVPFCALLLAALAGAALDWKRREGSRVPARLAIYGAVGFYVVLHLIFWSEIRYRQYVTPFLSIFAGVAAAAACRRQLGACVGSARRPRYHDSVL